MRDPLYAPQTALNSGAGRILHQANGGAAAAFEGGSLGVGFSGSGFLVRLKKETLIFTLQSLQAGSSSTT